ncbi:MAG TPA: glycosyltransferase family 4 protein [Bacteroidota bacterium]|jgi:glycosyltransferase involved in cell wall biosynthesis
MNPRSLHLCTSDAWGGLEIYACTLMLELRNAGIGVVAICKPGSRAETFLLEHGLEVAHLPNLRPVSPASIRTLRKLVREREIDVVHVHYHRDVWPASLALMGDSVRRLILSIYMGVPPKRDPLHRLIYSRVDAIVTSSEDLNRRLPELYAVPQERVRFVPYGRLLARYRRDGKRRAEIRAFHRVGESELLVGTMLRIDPGKGVMDFAESFPYIESGLRAGVVYIIVGEPTRKGDRGRDEPPFEARGEAYLRELESFIAANDLGGKVILAGFQNDLTGYLSAMDVFVFPSRDELYSLVVLDAMGMELPIVAAAAGGNLAQIEDGVTGLLYRVGDSRDLAAKLTQYLSDPGLRRRHGRAARESVEQKHDMAKTIGCLRELYAPWAPWAPRPAGTERSEQG